MLDFVVHHQFAIAAALYWIFSAAVSALPEPGEDAASGYVWLYRSRRARSPLRSS
jgi:hypothetical protein